jgi:hypothetical protein
MGEYMKGFEAGSWQEGVIFFNANGVRYTPAEYSLLQKLNSIEEKLDRLLGEGN